MNFPQYVYTLAGIALASSGAGERLYANSGASGWGVDAVLSRHVQEDELDGYLDMLRSSGVKWIRERGTSLPDDKARFADIRAGGFQVLAFAHEITPSGGTDWGPFPEDLREVYEEGRRQGRDFAEVVGAWELNNEPELAWWPDMPDRYASHAKALYLGLKAGARETGRDTTVLAGALGLPAGPWIERASSNGLLQYTDAWNIHYYGEDSQFSGLIDGHVSAMRDLLLKGEDALGELASKPMRWPVKEGAHAGALKRESDTKDRALPIWATEVGVSTVTPETWDDAERRQKQADFVRSTARQAYQRPEVSLFMPFVFVHQGDGYAMVESPGKVWPAWEQYSRYSRENAWPARPLVEKSRPVNPVVMQWLPDSRNASGHKLAGVYRWRAQGLPITGELRIYNFDSAPAKGVLRTSRGNEPWALVAAPGVGKILRDAAPPIKERLLIPAGGMLSVPLVFALEDAPSGGVREWRQFSFGESTGTSSQLGFSLERSPDLYPPDWEPLNLRDWSELTPTWQFLPHAVPSDERGPWQAVNGLKIVYAKHALARFEVGPNVRDPENPPYAAARVPGGLPDRGWLRVATGTLGPVPVRLRVDLIDSEGRRFCQWENLGHVRGLPLSAPRWLCLADFHPYGWGKLDERRRLRPSEVREVQLRFYSSRGPAMIDVELGFGVKYGTTLDSTGEVRLTPTSSSAQGAPVE